MYAEPLVHIKKGPAGSEAAAAIRVVGREVRTPSEGLLIVVARGSPVVEDAGSGGLHCSREMSQSAPALRSVLEGVVSQGTLEHAGATVQVGVVGTDYLFEQQREGRVEH